MIFSGSSRGGREIDSGLDKPNGFPKVDLSAAVTAFVLTVGDEPNFKECMEHLHSQSAKPRIELIEYISPLSAALQQMIDRCCTPFFVEVDEDMALFPHAVETLHNIMRESSERTALVCGGLWDCHMAFPVHGIKIYRHAIAKLFRFENIFSSDWTQFLRMRAEGYESLILPLGGRSNCLGEHGRHYTPETIFRRWRGLLQKHRRYHNMPWLDPWPARLLGRFITGRSRLDFYALLGAITGLVGDLPDDREVDFRDTCNDYQNLVAFFGLK